MVNWDVVKRSGAILGKVLWKDAKAIGSFAWEEMQKQCVDLHKKMDEVNREARFLTPEEMVKRFNNSTGTEKVCWAKRLKEDGINPKEYM